MSKMSKRELEQVKKAFVDQREWYKHEYHSNAKIDAEADWAIAMLDMAILKWKRDNG